MRSATEDYFDARKLFSTTDVIHGTIPYSALEEEVFDCPLVSRLHRVSQNSLVFLTFPSNRVKRFEHSLGVMHLAGKMFFSAVANTKIDVLQDFFNDIIPDIEKLVEKDTSKTQSNINDAFFSRKTSSAEMCKLDRSIREKTISIRTLEYHSFPDSPFYDRYIPGNVSDQYKFTYLVLLQGIRLAGLLHDVGHLPYSHTLERAMQTLIDKVVSDFEGYNIDNRKVFCDALINYDLEGKEALHERLGLAMFDIIESDVVKKIKYDDRRQDLSIIIPSFRIARALLDKKYAGTALYSLHPLISGMIDADRLDYCSRDLYCSGVRMDIIHYERLFLNLSLIKKVDSGTKRYLFLFGSKVAKEIEDFLLRRWSIYRDINYHHSVHKSETLLHNIIVDKSSARLKLPTSLSLDSKNNNDFIETMLSVLAAIFDNGDFKQVKDILIKFDDSWLDTLLKNLSTDIENESAAENSYIIDELTTNRKQYLSLLKRFNDFVEFDAKLFTLFKDSLELKNLISRLKEISGSSSDCVHIDENQIIKNAIAFLELILSLELGNYRVRFPGFICNLFISRADTVFSVFLGDNYSFFKYFENECYKALESSEYKDSGVIISRVSFSDGLNTMPIFVASNNTVGGLDTFSNICTTLREEKILLPTFHIYAKRDQFSSEDGQRECLKDFICAQFFKCAIDIIKSFADGCQEQADAY